MSTMPAEYAAKLAKVDAPPDGQPSATPAPIPPVHTTRDRFVALSRGEVLRAVTEIADATPEARESFQRFARLVDVVLSREYAARRHALREVYRQFDPDREDRATESDASSSREEVEFVMGHVGQLLDQASFDRLSLADIHSALRAATDFGVNLHVDFKVFDRLEVFARGDAVTRRRVRRWRNYFRVSEVEIPTYRMLAVVFRLLPNPKLTGRLDPHMVYVRLFKNIPKIDLEMLLPGTRYRLTMFDHGKILFPTLSGLAFVLFKLFKAALLLAVAGFYGLLAVLGLVGGTVGYGVRSFLGYLRTKDRYQLAVTQNLYYQNLDNNAGAILRAFEEAEEQQFRKVAMGYAALARVAISSTLTEEAAAAALARFAEESRLRPSSLWLADVRAALVRLRLVEETADGRLAIVPIGEACHRLAARVEEQIFGDGGATSDA